MNWRCCGKLTDEKEVLGEPSVLSDRYFGHLVSATSDTQRERAFVSAVNFPQRSQPKAEFRPGNCFIE